MNSHHWTFACFVKLPIGLQSLQWFVILISLAGVWVDVCEHTSGKCLTCHCQKFCSWKSFSHLVHGLTILKITSSPIFTHFHLSSSKTLAPRTTKFGRNCKGLTFFSSRVLSSPTEFSLINM